MNKLDKILYDKITEASNYIHKKSLENSGNWMIVSPKLAEAILNLDIKRARRKKLERINLKNKLENMNIITLCGSTKYKDEFQMANKWLTLQGNIVISVAMFGHVDKEPLSKDDKILLDEIHKKKIDLADEIFVVDVDGYIGESTKKEIEYAIFNNKNVRFLSDEKDGFELWKKNFYNREIVDDWNK
jgi:hypothetical protein